MTNFEDELKKALQRQDPSPGFAARVVARAEESRQPRWSLAWLTGFAGQWRMTWAAGLAAMLTLGLVVTSEYRQRKAERAGREAVIALRIASEKLNFARDKVLDIERSRPAQPAK